MKLTFFLLFTTFTLIGQNIKGTVLENETNQPLENVNIYFSKIKTGTVTNEKGEFNLELQSKINPTDTLRFSIIGYDTKVYTFLELKEHNYVVHLLKKVEDLDEVTLLSNKKLKPRLPYNNLSPLKKAIAGFGSTLIDDKIYIIGGDESFSIDNVIKSNKLDVLNLDNELYQVKASFDEINLGEFYDGYSDRLQIYDLNNDSWTSLKLKFRKRAYHKVIYFENNLYVLGGIRLSNNKTAEFLDDKIEIFNIKKNEIVVDNTNPHQAVNFASFVYKDNIIVIGGSIKLKKNGVKILTDKSHAFNIPSGYWYELPKMTKPKEVNGVIIGDKIYLIGGFNNNALTEIESFDLISGEWKKEGDLFDAMENPALAYHDHTIYIYDKGKFLTFDTQTKVLNEFKINLILKNAQLQYYKNNLYLIGGYVENSYEKLTSSGLYAISLNELQKTQVFRSTKFD